MHYCSLEVKFIKTKVHNSANRNYYYIRKIGGIEYEVYLWANNALGGNNSRFGMDIPPDNTNLNVGLWGTFMIKK